MIDPFLVPPTFFPGHRAPSFGRSSVASFVIPFLFGLRANDDDVTCDGPWAMHCHGVARRAVRCGGFPRPARSPLRLSGFCGRVQASTVADGSMVGMKAVVEGATVEEGSIVAAGAVVVPDTVVGAGQVRVLSARACSFFFFFLRVTLLAKHRTQAPPPPRG